MDVIDEKEICVWTNMNEFPKCYSMLLLKCVDTLFDCINKVIKVINLPIENVFSKDIFGTITKMHTYTSLQKTKNNRTNFQLDRENVWEINKEIAVEFRFENFHKKKNTLEHICIGQKTCVQLRIKELNFLCHWNVVLCFFLSKFIFFSSTFTSFHFSFSFRIIKMSLFKRKKCWSQNNNYLLIKFKLCLFHLSVVCACAFSCPSFRNKLRIHTDKLCIFTRT